MSEADSKEDSEKRITQLIDGLTQKERQTLLFALTELSIGPVPALDGSRLAILPFCGKVMPGETKAMQVHCYETFKPERLIISEPIADRYTQITELFYDPPKMPWWKWQKRVNPRSKTTTQITRERTSPSTVFRGIWEISGIYFGNKAQFNTLANLCGDLFAPDKSGVPGLAMDVCQANLSITLQVRHSSKDVLPFHAVFLGKYLSRDEVKADHRTSATTSIQSGESV